MRHQIPGRARLKATAPGFLPAPAPTGITAAALVTPFAKALMQGVLPAAVSSSVRLGLQCKYGLAETARLYRKTRILRPANTTYPPGNTGIVPAKKSRSSFLYPRCFHHC